MTTNKIPQLDFNGNPFPELPDGSGFFVGSMPLPANHWIYSDSEPPPMPWRCGVGRTRDRLAADVKMATRYAVKAATMNGKNMDFDPDAMCQLMVTGLLGYRTDTGAGTESWENPSPLPPDHNENEDVEPKGWIGEPGNMLCANRRDIPEGIAAIPLYASPVNVFDLLYRVASYAGMRSYIGTALHDKILEALGEHKR